MLHSLKKNESGFSIIELLVALAIGLIILGVMVKVFIYQQKAYDVQGSVTEMQQNVRGAMDMIVDELKMAGFRPNLSGTSFTAIATGTSQVQIVADLNRDGATTGTDEDITYTLDTVNLQIERNSGPGAQPIAENILSMDFILYDENDNPTNTSDDVRKVKITIVGQAANADPNYSANNGYRTFSLVAYVTTRNLLYLAESTGSGSGGDDDDDDDD